MRSPSLSSLSVSLSFSPSFDVGEDGGDESGAPAMAGAIGALHEGQRPSDLGPYSH